MNKYKPDLPSLNRQWRRMLYSKIENIFEYEHNFESSEKNLKETQQTEKITTVYI